MSSVAPIPTTEPPRQLLADEDGVLRMQGGPDIGRRLDHGKMRCIGFVRRHADDVDRPFADARLRAPDRQDRADVGLRARPRLDVARVGGRRRLEIDFGDETRIEPAREGLPKTLDHAADADIGRERDEQRHQRKRQSGNFLTSVGEEPARERVMRQTLAERQGAGERDRQEKSGAKKRTADHGESGCEPVAKAVGASRGDKGERASAPCRRK